MYFLKDKYLFWSVTISKNTLLSWQTEALYNQVLIKFWIVHNFNSIWKMPYTINFPYSKIFLLKSFNHFNRIPFPCFFLTRYIRNSTQYILFNDGWSSSHGAKHATNHGNEHWEREEKWHVERFNCPWRLVSWMFFPKLFHFTRGFSQYFNKNYV